MILVKDACCTRFARMIDGEDLMSNLATVPLDSEAAVLSSGVGMLRDVRIGYWAGERYEEILLADPMELLSMQGNIGHDGEKRIIHCHVTLARKDGSAVGGHLLSATVHNTVELHVVPLPGVRMTRRRERNGLMSLHPESL